VKKKKTPPKLDNLLEKIKQHIANGEYSFTTHALSRQIERGIDTLTALYVLKTGYEEKKKTKFDETCNTWKYAIRGRTLDDLDVRIIVAIHNKIIVITVINLMEDL